MTIDKFLVPVFCDINLCSSINAECNESRNHFAINVVQGGACFALRSALLLCLARWRS